VNATIPWVLALGLTTSGAPSIRAGVDSVNVELLPQSQKENYEVFQVRCSKCHTLARPLNARLRGEDWRPYIKKMTRRAGSGINDASGQKIFEFLKTYGEILDAESKREEAPPSDPPTPLPGR
jgi:hypothetical protein